MLQLGLSTPAGAHRRTHAIRSTLALLAMVTSLLIFSYSRYIRDQRNLDICVRNEEAISDALHVYASDHHGQYPPTLESLTRTDSTTTRYIAMVTGCQEHYHDTYGYEVASPPTAFTVFCQGNYHHRAYVALPDHPLISSTRGLDIGAVAVPPEPWRFMRWLTLSGPN
jgi:type II secretory pathway pseudopilin PulG